MFTYQDAIDHLVDYIGGGPSDVVLRDCRRAVLESYREVVNSHRWPYLYRHGRVVTTRPFASGTDASPGVPLTFAYDHTGGTYERMATLTGGIWPSWAAGGYLRIASTEGQFDCVAYRVAQRNSATVVTLEAEVNPGADIPAGAEFILYQDTYLLPADFVAQDQALYEQNFGTMSYRHPRDWLFEQRYVFAEGIPVAFTVTGDPQYPGRLVMKIFPWPNAQKTVDFIYSRRPRPLTVQAATSGTTSATQGSTTISTTAAIFTPGMVGATIRLSPSPKAPSSQVGSAAGYNPPAFESSMASYISPTSASLADASPATLSGVGYTISDPIDFEPGAMLNAFLRCCEKTIAAARSLKNSDSAQAAWKYALEQAKAASSTSFARRHAGPGGRFHPRLIDYPQGPDQP